MLVVARNRLGSATGALAADLAGPARMRECCGDEDALADVAETPVVSDESAHVTVVPVSTVTPIPGANASPPTRPM